MQVHLVPRHQNRGSYYREDRAGCNLRYDRLLLLLLCVQILLIDFRATWTRSLTLELSPGQMIPRNPTFLDHSSITACAVGGYPIHLSTQRLFPRRNACQQHRMTIRKSRAGPTETLYYNHLVGRCRISGWLQHLLLHRQVFPQCRLQRATASSEILTPKGRHPHPRALGSWCPDFLHGRLAALIL